MEFESIPGVGKKIASALEELDDAETAVLTGDVARIASAPNVTPGRAARIARAAIRHRHGESGDFLATDRARAVYDELLGLVADRAVTDYAERRLETFYPSRAESRIEEVRELVSTAIGREVDDRVVDALGGLGPLEPPAELRIDDRCLVTADAEAYSAAREAIPEVTTEIVDDARGVAELARGYSSVIVLDERFAGIDIDADGEVRIEPDALEDPVRVVPERVLAFFAANRDRIRAAVAVARRADLEVAADIDGIETALEGLDADGSVAGDDELDRLERAVGGLDAAVEAAEAVANEDLRAAIRDRDVTIDGADLLSLVEQGAGVDSILSRELADAFEAAVGAARDRLVSGLELEGAEAEAARRAFPDEPTFPVEADASTVGRLRESLVAARDRRAVASKRALAADLGEHRPAVEALVERALEFDVELAIARFTRDFDCTLPEFGGRGVAIESGRSPLLDVAFEAVEPVDYAVEGVTVLSGVNSGGKTSTLDLIAAVVILAHMGFPVPAAAARLERFDALHYFTKSRGTLDAGAFEHTLTEFDALLEDAGGDLVLVDELESITEPGASATIVAGILELLADRGATAVFVSHLAGEIRDEADLDLRIDGIEALGLEDGELVVNRSPREDHLARSTPELIVEKLAAEGDSAFFARLLEKFEDGDG